MNTDQLHMLIQKYVSGTITEIERKSLDDWYGSYESPLVWVLDPDEDVETVKNRIFNKILAETRNVNARKRRKILYYGRVAAVALVVAVAGIMVSRYLIGANDNIIANVPNQQKENRFLLLPDSSRIVLRPGSSLEFVSNFEGKTREIALKGEAYFDIQSRPNQPFIIHTGSIKTKVVGTKFTIKANEKNVGVRVKEGKVQVYNDGQILGNLIADEEITYSQKTKKVVYGHFSFDSKRDWTIEDDMDFDGLSFGALTEKLERRYGVHIQFQNKSLAHCLVSGRFKGLETIQEVLQDLCDTRNASFVQVSKTEFRIHGDGCY